MNYTKPEVKTLGQAKSVIEQSPLIKQVTGVLDSSQPPRNKFNPAYDLDE
jgi:hypothetical protein